MPISFDIAQPVSGQNVGATFTVVGSFSNDDGSPFGVQCWLAVANTTTPVQVQTPQINFEQKTWQCTFQNVAIGSYDINVDVGPTTQSLTAIGGPGSSPPVEVTVGANKIVTVSSPLSPTNAGVAASSVPPQELKMTRVPVSGTCQPGYDISTGHVPYVYLRVGGQQVSTRGRLTHVWMDSDSGLYRWTYDLFCHNWAISDATVLIVDLWKVHFEAPSTTEPDKPLSPEYSVSCRLCT